MIESLNTVYTCTQLQLRFTTQYSNNTFTSFTPVAQALLMGFLSLTREELPCIAVTVLTINDY